MFLFICFTMFLVNGKKRSSIIAYEKFPPQKQEGQMKYNIKAYHIVESRDRELVVSIMLSNKEGPKNSQYD